jgi:hypothetical protein
MKAVRGWLLSKLRERSGFARPWAGAVLALSALACAGLFSLGASAEEKKPAAESKPAAGETAPAKPGEKAKPDGKRWKSLFDGKTLKGWKETDFYGRGKVTIKDGTIVLGMGNDMTGITSTEKLPKIDYEVELDAMRVEGSDFFCALTFPVGDSPCSLVVGGWGGGVVGLSSINGADASENETSKYMSFKPNRWYHIRLRVTKNKIEAWIDKEKLVDVELADKKLGIRLEVELSKPFGIATWCTTGALKDIKIRPLGSAKK